LLLRAVVFPSIRVRHRYKSQLAYQVVGWLAFCELDDPCPERDRPPAPHGHLTHDTPG